MSEVESKASKREPPYDGSPPCPFCPDAVRNLYAVAHNLSIGAADTTLADLARAVELCRPLADAHFVDTMHSHGMISCEDESE